VNWIQTHSGKKFSLIDPQPEDVDLDDIIHALSNTCRFYGHCNEFYSVAQHSILTAHLVKKYKYTALLHDAGEAYYGDISRPFKQILKQNEFFGNILKRIDEVISISLKTKNPVPREVKDADNIALATEKRDLLKNQVDWDGFLPKPAKLKIIPLPSKTIEPMFRRAIYANFHNH